MDIKKQRIAITSIGSGVGQSIVDSCHLSNIPTELFGYGFTPYAFGSYDCKHRRILPSIYASSYIDKLIEFCVEDNIDILLPGLDDELIILSENIKIFNDANIYIPISSAKVLRLCRDKEIMTNELSVFSDCFVTSYNKKSLLEKSERDELNYPLIAKPKDGFASRGIIIIRSKNDIGKIDESHVIQTIALPKSNSTYAKNINTSIKKGILEQTGEISAQILIGKSGKELGRMATCNNLQSGIPIQIVPVEVPEVWSAIDNFLPKLIEMGARGPINIQGRLTDNGPRFFELNARFTGITGLRAMLGFNEVEKIILDNQLHSSPNMSYNKRKIGIRQVKNRVVDIDYDNDLHEKISFLDLYDRKPGMHIMVTGANGYLGSALINKLLIDERVEKITALVRDTNKFKNTKSKQSLEKITVLDINALYDGRLAFGLLDAVVHLASARPGHTSAEIAASLRLTSDLTNLAARFHLPVFINASSQAVYGTSVPPLWEETLPPMPETLYAQAKLASELMTKSIRTASPATQAISLRLAQLVGTDGYDEVTHHNQVLHHFIKQALNKEELLILGGEQTLDMLDVEDAVDVITLLTLNSYKNLPDIINIGSGHPLTINEIAWIVSDMFNEHLDFKPTIIRHNNHCAPSFGMNTSIITNETTWKPKCSTKNSSEKILRKLLRENA